MNITDTIDPKVDQLTADHLIGRTMIIRVTGVELTGGEQPCEIHYEGEAGLPYRPGKSMRRVLVHVWGGDVNKYVGRSMRLYRDDDVQFGGLKVGGVRISHMSDITSPQTLALTAKKGSKKAFKVMPLEAEKPAAPPPPPEPEVDEALIYARDLCARVRAVKTMAELEAITSEPDVIAARARLDHGRPKLAERIAAAVNEMIESLDFPGTVPGDRA